MQSNVLEKNNYNPNNMSLDSMSLEEKISRICLYRSQNIGAITYRNLLAIHKSGTKALEALPKIAERGGLNAPLKIYSRDLVKKEMLYHKQIGAKLIIDGEKEFPQELQNIHEAPPVLSIRGNANIFTKPAISIVGARNCSLGGKKLAHSIANDLGAAGYVIISGLARGIDTQAHLGSIKTGTIAVIAGGIDKIYPPENEYLFHKIAQEGAIISESAFGTEPKGNLFPRRNYIIAGLSKCVVVVEAALKSGSCITARNAGDLGKEVCVIPGSPLDPRYVGSNNLISRDGAALVTSAQDVIDIIKGPCQRKLHEYNDESSYSSHSENNLDNIDPNELIASKIKEKILGNLSKAPITVDEVIRSCTDPTSVVLSAILELEISGKITRHPGNMISI